MIRLEKRIALHPDDDYNTEKCWLKEIDILCNDMNETIDFSKNRCTGEEFSWISKVFDGDGREKEQEKYGIIATSGMFILGENLISLLL